MRRRQPLRRYAFCGVEPLANAGRHPFGGQKCFHNSGRELVRASFDCWRGTMNAHTRSGLTTFRVSERFKWATELWRAREAKVKRNEASGQKTPKILGGIA